MECKLRAECPGGGRAARFRDEARAPRTRVREQIEQQKANQPSRPPVGVWPLSARVCQACCPGWRWMIVGAGRRGWSAGLSAARATELRKLDELEAG